MINKQDEKQYRLLAAWAKYANEEVDSTYFNKILEETNEHDAKQTLCFLSGYFMHNDALNHLIESYEYLLNDYCKICGSKLEHKEEYLCDSCFTKEMRKDLEYAKEHPEETEAEYERDSDDWRFRDSRGRSVFRE